MVVRLFKCKDAIITYHCIRLIHLIKQLISIKNIQTNK